MTNFIGTRRARGIEPAPQCFPAGAFYSPVVNAEEVLREPEFSRIWPVQVQDPHGFDLCGKAQLALLDHLAQYQLPVDALSSGPTYDPKNDQFPPQDAALLYAMIRHLRPRRVVEVGCGWSTIVIARAIEDGRLDTHLTCIDPYPVPFVRSIRGVSELREERVEHSPIELFESLAAGDVMFIDSSHVVKTGSDVVHQVLHVLPRLSAGVVVHVHDIFIPEDYPQGWVRQGFGWNEQYLVHAFLVGHAGVRILAMNHWLTLRHFDRVTAAFGDVPPTGSSIWFSLGDSARSPDGEPSGIYAQD